MAIYTYFSVVRRRSPSVVTLDSCRGRTATGCGMNWLTSKHNTGSWRLKGLSLFSSSLIMAINTLLTIAVSKQCYYYYSKNLGKTFWNGIITITARILENLSEQYSARILEILSEWYYYYYRKNLQKPVKKYYYYDSKSPGKRFRMVLLLLRQKFAKTFQNGVISITAKKRENFSEWCYYYYSKILKNLSEQHYYYSSKNP